MNKEDGYLGKVKKEEKEGVKSNGKCLVCGGPLTKEDGLFVCLKCRRRKDNKDESSNNT